VTENAADFAAEREVVFPFVLKKNLPGAARWRRWRRCSTLWARAVPVPVRRAALAGDRLSTMTFLPRTGHVAWTAGASIHCGAGEKGVEQGG
jgi:hypothetical protein